VSGWRRAHSARSRRRRRRWGRRPCQRQRKLDAAKKAHELQELDGCTFKPAINPPLADKRAKSSARKKEG
jgi:hypothetical protein